MGKNCRAKILETLCSLGRRCEGRQKAALAKEKYRVASSSSYFFSFTFFFPWQLHAYALFVLVILVLGVGLFDVLHNTCDWAYL